MLKVIISGGGTGGHIFPAIAIANAIVEQRADAKILFVGAKGRMEMQKIPAEGYPVEGLWISGWQRKHFWKNLVLPLKILSAVMRSITILNSFKPDVVVGVGGYSSGPVLFAASLRKIPALIQEQNSYPGFTNRLLAKRVNRICIAYEGTERYFPREKIVKTGNPVCKDIEGIRDKRLLGVKFFGFSSNLKTVLALGGSLGARTINESMKRLVPLLVKKEVQVIWQTGKAYYKEIRTTLLSLSAEDASFPRLVRVYPFIDRMDLAYATADLIISRAGAIAISELCIVGKPAVLIPSPNVADDHQTKNALDLEGIGAAIVVRDGEAVEKLPQVVHQLLENSQKTEMLSRQIAQLAVKDAAAKIAAEVINLTIKAA